MHHPRDLFSLHLHFCCRTNLDHSNPTREFGNALLQFVPIVLRCGVFQLMLDLRDAILEALGSAAPSTIVVLSLLMVTFSRYPDRPASLFKLKTYFLANHSASSEGRDVLEHCFALFTKAWRFHRCHFNDATHAVNH